MKHTSTRRGFTLIELLVVVLIIGILAAVAVPQYQKAVLKSRAAQAWVGINTLEKAQQAYFLANGHYTEDLSALDMEFPNSENYRCYGNETTSWCQADIDEASMFELVLREGALDTRSCIANENNPANIQLCSSYGPFKTAGFDKPYRKYYTIE